MLSLCSLRVYGVFILKYIDERQFFTIFKPTFWSPTNSLCLLLLRYSGYVTEYQVQDKTDRYYRGRHHCCVFASNIPGNDTVATICHQHFRGFVYYSAYQWQFLVNSWNYQFISPYFRVSIHNTFTPWPDNYSSPDNYHQDNVNQATHPHLGQHLRKICPDNSPQEKLELSWMKWPGELSGRNCPVRVVPEPVRSTIWLQSVIISSPYMQCIARWDIVIQLTLEIWSCVWLSECATAKSVSRKFKLGG